jgi:hypothetical protein
MEVSSRFHNPAVRVVIPHWTGGSVALRVGLDAMRKVKILPRRESNQDFMA